MLNREGVTSPYAQEIATIDLLLISLLRVCVFKYFLGRICIIHDLRVKVVKICWDNTPLLQHFPQNDVPKSLPTRVCPIKSQMVDFKGDQR